MGYYNLYLLLMSKEKMRFMIKDRINGRKRAEITIEFLLMIVMALLVIYVVMNLTGGNLKTMSTHGGINNMFKPKTTMADDTTPGPDYSNPNSQVSVEVMADADAEIKGFHDGAQNELENLLMRRKESNTNTLSLADQKEMMKWATLYTLSKNPQVSDTIPLPVTMMISDYNVIVNTTDYKTTSNAIGEIKWKYGSELKYGSNVSTERLKVLEYVSGSPFQ